MVDDTHSSPPPGGRRAPSEGTKKSAPLATVVAAKEKKGADMAKCTKDSSTPVKSNPPERESLLSEDKKRSCLRPNGQWDFQVLQIEWNHNAQARRPLSVRGFAKKHNVPESSLRYVLKMGTPEGSKSFILKNQGGKWYHYGFSAAKAEKIHQERISQRGIRGTVTNKVVDFFKPYLTKYKSIEYARKEASKAWTGEKPFPSRSALYRATRNGYIVDSDGETTFYSPYKKAKKAKRNTHRNPRNHNPQRLYSDLTEEMLTHSEPGHFQMDTVVSKSGTSGGFLVVYDPYIDGPNYRRAFIRKLNSLQRKEIARALRSIVYAIRRKHFPLKTILTDNGNEFLNEAELERIAGAQLYYCHPYSAWEKGAVENLNRLIRRVYCKGTDLSTVSKAKTKELETFITHYPRPLKKPKTENAA